MQSVSFSTALEHVRHVEILTTELDRLYRTAPSDRAGIGYAQQHLGIELKLAAVQASLAQAEALDRLGNIVDDLALALAGDDVPSGLVDRTLAAVHAIVPAGRPIEDGPQDRCATCDSPAVTDVVDGVGFCRLHGTGGPS
jgi:hypothetical protein